MRACIEVSAKSDLSSEKPCFEPIEERKNAFHLPDGGVAGVEVAQPMLVEELLAAFRSPLATIYATFQKQTKTKLKFLNEYVTFGFS